MFGTAALLLLTACGAAAPSAAPTPSEVRLPESWSLIDRARSVEGANGMVVSAHALASAAGVEILEAGGNAVDAAVAVGFALAAVHPAAGNIGGGGFLVHRSSEGDVRALDYREKAPGKATRDMFLDGDGNLTDRSVVGHLAAGVPGSVAGMSEMHRELGSLPWARLLEPAIRLADGHQIDSVRSRLLRGGLDGLSRLPVTRRTFLDPSGDAWAPGSMWRQPELAETLRQIAEGGADAFYTGPIADLIVAEMERGGGIISRADLATYQAAWRTPVTVNYRGYAIHSMPPSSSGGVTMGQLLNIVEGYDPLPPFGSAELIHLESEAMRRAFTDRNVYLGDPDFVDMPVDRLLSEAYAAELRTEILPDQATPTPEFVTAIREGQHTTHYSIVDAEGNAASVTTTLNAVFLSGVTVTGAGFLLNQEMDDFAAAPGRPNQFGLVQGEANAVAPGKRMLSAMTPSIVVDPGDRLHMVVGAPGGPTIITAVYHVISNVIDHGMPLADAISAPRTHHQALPDVIQHELDGVIDAERTKLEAMGHVLAQYDWGRFMANVNAVRRTSTGWEGVADPRLGGAARAY